MAAIWGTALVIVAASLLAGAAIMRLLGLERPTATSAAAGFAALTIACSVLVHLPGRAATAAVIALAGVGACAAYLGRRPARAGHPLAASLCVAAVLAVGALPFLLNDSTGPLGEGLYTNDQAAQLYWTDWLQHGVGPEPAAVRFGYPTGPQSLTAAAAEVTGASLEDAFNGLLLAIAALTALTAFGALEALPTGRRAVAACVAGLPYLGASFLAQSAFKETGMALLVLAGAIALDRFARGEARRAWAGALVLLAGAAILTYSLPGLAWLGLALPAWLVLEALAGRNHAAAARALWRERARPSRSRRRALALGLAAIALAGVVALEAGQVASFFSKLGSVQGSPGRLSSPVFPGEALGVWPEGDFQIVRGEVSGAIPAAAFGLLCAALGGIAALRRRDNGVAAMLGAAIVAYAVARLTASIYVQAKALAVMAPLVAFAVLRALLARRGESGLELAWRPRWPASARVGLGAAFAAAAAASTLLALRAAPVGFDERGHELETLAKRVGERPLAFLGVDRFAGYWLRGTLAAAPGGYVPADVRARPEKVWLQGQPTDLDTLRPRKLNGFDYAITTSAGYQSSPPPGLREVARTPSFVLWRRVGRVPRLEVLSAGEAAGHAPEDGAPGAILDCSRPDGAALARAGGTAWVLPRPAVGQPSGWSPGAHFDAPASASQELRLGPGRWRLSLQYHSQVALSVRGPSGPLATLPPWLGGMYLSDFNPGWPQDSFWPAGELRVRARGPVRITVSAAEPSGLQDALGVRRQVWLGQIAATRAAPPERVPLARACGRYVDHYLSASGG